MEIQEKTVTDPDARRVEQLYRPIEHIRTFKAKDASSRERAIRLYCTQFGSSWTLQVRAPISLGSSGYGGEGKESEKLDELARLEGTSRSGAIGLLIEQFYRPIEHVRTFKVKHADERERAIRLYCTQFGSRLGVDEMRALRDAINAFLVEAGEDA